MKPWALLLLLAVATPASALDPWTWQDTAGEFGFVALTAVDWHQTRWALDRGHAEMNPLLGSHPNRARLDLTVLGAVVGHALVSAALPAGPRRWWQGITMGVEVYAVSHNAITLGGRF